MADNATATLGIEVKGVGVKETAQDLDKLDTSAKKVAQTTRDLGAAQQQSTGTIKNVSTAQAELVQRTTATSRAMDFFRGVFGGATEEISRGRAVHGLYAAAASQTTEAVTKTASATHGLRAAMATLNPVLAGAGAQFGAFGGLIAAARAGMGGLAIAIGGSLLASLERASEGTEVLRKRFTALGGDTKQFEQLKQIARETGASLESLTSTTQTLNNALERGQTGKWIGDLSKISQNSTLAAKSLADLSKAAGADFAAVSEALKGILAGGKLTKEIFLDIVRANEAVGLAIAKAFRQPSIAAFVADLERAPRPARELKAALEGIGPIASDASGRTTTLTSALGQLKQGFLDLADALGTTFIGKAISAFGQFLSWAAKAISAIGQMNAAINSLTFGRRGAPQSSGGPSFQTNDSTLFDSGSTTSGTAFGPPPGSVTAPSSGGFNSPPNSVSGSQFMGEEFVGAFASGGSFMVGGTGSTDSKRIAMNVTPGERVTVTPPSTNSTPIGTNNRGVVNINVFGVQSPAAFIQSSSQIRRAARQALA